MDETFKTIFESTFIGGTLLVVLYGIWRACVWLADNVLIPLRDRLISHIDHVDKATSSMMELIGNQTDLIKQQNLVLTKMDEAIATTGAGTIGNTKVLERIDKNLDNLKSRSDQFFREQHHEHLEKTTGSKQ